jgi:DNA-binding NtrC family response regulator
MRDATNEKLSKAMENGVLDQTGKTSAVESWAADGAVLVIEDCEPLLFYLDSALISLGFFNQHLAANLAEAEAVWAQHKDQIRHVLLNYELPDGISVDFAARIRAERPDLNIIVTTGYDLASVREACRQPASFQYLQKPFRLLELKDCLGRYAKIPDTVAIAR